MENSKFKQPFFYSRHNLKYPNNYTNNYDNKFSYNFENKCFKSTNTNTKKFMMYKKNIFCVNCGERGHIVKECKAPITSYGIIAFKVNNSPLDDINDKNDELVKLLKSESIIDNDNTYPKIKFLMIQRKDTIGYIDFIRGKYNDIKTCIDEMTQKEKKNLLTKTFDELWNELWICNKSHENFYKQEYNQAKKKFNQIDIQNLIGNSDKSKFNYSEFSFAKGRRDIKEQAIDCAEREFSEETGYDKSSYDFIKEYPIIEEQFKGTNGIMYKHVYYLVKMKESYLKSPIVIDTNNIIQMSEVKNVGWFSFNECLALIRPYDVEKKKILTKIYNDLLCMNHIYKI